MIYWVFAVHPIDTFTALDSEHIVFIPVAHLSLP
jgi:hypothetical protein